MALCEQLLGARPAATGRASRRGVSQPANRGPFACSGGCASFRRRPSAPIKLSELATCC